MTPTTLHTEKPTYGPALVAAWFDTVILPMLSGLRGEENLLEKGNYTYRHYPEELSFFSRTDDLIMSGAWLNYRQFLASFYETLAGTVALHDAEVAQLFIDCKALFAALLASEDFTLLFDKLTKQFAADSHESVDVLFGAIRDESERKAIVAEYIVNNVLDLGRYDATSKLWGPNRQSFLALKQLNSVQPLAEALNRTAARLKEAIKNLRSVLEELSDRLSREKDVPIVLPGRRLA